ncbi:RNA polymerase sigma-70 factor (ECF subfamily) [Stackebrandtia endophytica]|uniref:RNA polymerase sigma-70 factor (ECF subfamily) n=1 Tax=Stackebrandtia endophytica TaxID=1496996 RepID=A0A543APW4_9ACTN|nr:RNA polymerase sigma-70 factor [Stackebrandtia endophytica]TQL74607.1 RNA polymerase sigma-70 factor (ECF subfamily) [Stackebrandtia endophytica]
MIEEFEEHRGLLLGVAYRLLGSMWDAEDVVQEAFLRWSGTDRAEVRSVRAFLMTVVTRLALDQLRSARVRRETYPGPWLPEPVAGDQVGPLDTVELRDSLSYATLHLMERLTPPERAVVVLREAFQLPYEEIAAVVGVSASTCRQLFRRGKERLGGDDRRVSLEEGEHRRLLERFMVAASGGDLSELTNVLAEDVVAYTDGGGRVRAALRPVVGRDRVMAFVAGLVRRFGVGEYSWIDVNGGVGLRIGMSQSSQVVVAEVSGGRICRLFAVMNPDKLARVG